MSAPHTPGPWEACNPGDYSDFDGYSRVVCSADPDDMRRIAVVHWSARYPENDANARLIAAAPVLLAALEGVMDILGSAESNASGNPEWDYVGPRIAKARAAIAKARGQ